MREEKFAGCATRGKRDYQEDFHGFFPTDDGTVLAVLADGMGGHIGGAEAAQIAVGAFIDSFSKACKKDAEPRLSDEMLQVANGAILAKVDENKSLAGMGCTLVVALVRDNSMTWLSVGDSLLYLFANGRLVKLNADHSIGGLLDEAVAAGKITPEEAADNPQRHALRSALMGEKIKLIDRGEIGFDITAPPIIIIASDGLLTLGASGIESCLNTFYGEPPQWLADKLIQEVEAQNLPHQDNTTTLVIKPNPSR